MFELQPVSFYSVSFKSENEIFTGLFDRKVVKNYPLFVTLDRYSVT